MNDFIPFAKVDCSGNELTYVKEVLDSGWLTSAGKTHEFENRFALLHDVPYACTVNSCTSGLHLALEACGVSEGTQVFVPSLTFTASAEVVRYLNADPVFVDVNFDTCLLTPNILKTAIKNNPKVKYLIYVHFAGQIAYMEDGDYGEGIVSLCKRHGITIIEDAAHAFPSSQNGKRPGQFGDAACFSFYANKTITTGEGGMVLTRNEQIFNRMKVMRLHGINRDVWNRFTTNKPSWEYDVIAPGFKYNMPDINAAIGLAQLEVAEEMRYQRQRCAEYYYKHLDDKNIILPKTKVSMEDHSWHLFVIRLNESCSLDRNFAIEKLSEMGVGTSVHYKPLHQLSYYRNHYELNTNNFPNSERHWRNCISLPIYPTLKNECLDYICTSVNSLLK